MDLLLILVNSWIDYIKGFKVSSNQMVETEAYSGLVRQRAITGASWENGEWLWLADRCNTSLKLLSKVFSYIQINQESRG